MRDRIDFSIETIKKLVWSKSHVTYYYDKKVFGLRLVISKAGTKTFQLYTRFDGKPLKVKVGNFPQMTPIIARKKANEYLSQIHSGINPNKTKTATTNEKTYADLWETYFESLKRKARRNPSTEKKNINQHLCLYNKYKKFHKLKISQIKKDKLVEFHRDYSFIHGKPVMADNIIRQIRACINFHEIEPNPAQKIKLNPKNKRAKYLTKSDMEKFLPALVAETRVDWRDVFTISLFTGARIGFIMSMNWDDIDLIQGHWTFINKTSEGRGDETILGLPEEVIEILSRRRNFKNPDCPWVFPANSKSGHLCQPQNAFARILKRADLKGFTPHDLRRTAASWMANANVNQSTITKMLGNKSESTTEIYARLHTDTVVDRLQPVIKDMLKTAKIKQII